MKFVVFTDIDLHRKVVHKTFLESFWTHPKNDILIDIFEVTATYLTLIFDMFPIDKESIMIDTSRNLRKFSSNTIMSKQ
jgi:hypothetical protein